MPQEDREVRAVDEVAFVAQRAAISNRLQLEARSAAALTANRAYLAITSPAQAQVVAQVRALTAQNTALIRLLLNDTSGTD